MTYQFQVDQLKELRPNIGWRAYEYQGTERFQEFEEFSRFCITNLEEFAKVNNLPPIFFCYDTDNTIDGKAGNSYGVPYIFLNRGIIDVISQFFMHHEAAFVDPEFNEFRAMREQLNLALGFIMFQQTSLFAFYHERAHILQMKREILKWKYFNQETKNLTERYAVNLQESIYCEKEHAMEFDADINAAQLCSMHVFQFPGTNGNEQHSRLLASLSVAGILTYWLYLCNGNYDLYFKRGNHPHPLIRAFYITDTMLRQLSLMSGANFDPAATLNSALRIVDALYEHQENHPIQAFFHALEDSGDEIEAFVNELIASCDNYPHLLRNQDKKPKALRLVTPRGLRYSRCKNRVI